MSIGIEELRIIEIMSQQQNTKTVIVTGAAGYIGGSICIELKKQGYTVVGVDRRKLPEHLESYVDRFIHECFTHPFSLEEIEKNPIGIIHCAGTSLVGPSVIDPWEYYDNNVSKTLKYLDYIRRWAPKIKFIFSSSASVYGQHSSNHAIFESSGTAPISPYGESKLMVEQILHSFNKAYKMDYVSFRYFNACGAVQEGIHGQEPGATHIFAKLFEAAITNEHFTMYGTDYNTKDGTCIRDYVHVTDIAKAHISAIENNIKGIYNIGSLKGYSNLQIYKAVDDYLIKKKRIDNSIVVVFDKARQGDPAILIANSSKLKRATSWKPEKNLDNIICDLHNWYYSDTFNKMQQRSSDAHPS